MRHINKAYTTTTATNATTTTTTNNNNTSTTKNNTTTTVTTTTTTTTTTSGGPGIESRWRRSPGFFSWIPTEPCALGSTQPLKNEYQGFPWG